MTITYQEAVEQSLIETKEINYSRNWIEATKNHVAYGNELYEKVMRKIDDSYIYLNMYVNTTEERLKSIYIWNAQNALNSARMMLNLNCLELDNLRK